MNKPITLDISAEVQRVGDWMETFTGKVIYPLDPREEEICIEDIAHGLAFQCRFNGHTNKFYSVAEHSVRVSQAVPPGDALWGLLHDAAEAYLGDVIRPLKTDHMFGEYVQVERQLQDVIFQKFGLRGRSPYRSIPSSIKIADLRLLETEKRDLMNAEPFWSTGYPPLEWKIEPFESPETAEKRFLDRFYQLTKNQEDDNEF